MTAPAPEAGRVDVHAALDAADWYLAGYGSDDEYELFQAARDAVSELVEAAKAFEVLARRDTDEGIRLRRALAACDRANGENGNG